MYCITEQQTEYILNDIRRRGVELKDLQLNLLDHVCCIVEQNLKEGDDFENFYQQTIKQFFKHELWEIEEETITLLTFKNYYAMKKTMIVSGAISVIALFGGSFFKIMHWPGAGMMLLLGIGILSLLFLPLMFLLRAKETNSGRDKVVAGIGTLVGVLVCLATLFKIMHWPGASFLWLATSAISILVFIPLFFFTGIRKPETKLNTIITTIILVGATGLLFSLTNVRPSRFFEVSSVNANIKNAFLTEELKNTNAAVYGQLISDTSYKHKDRLSEFHTKCSLLYDQIDSLKNILAEGSHEFKFSWKRDNKWKDYAFSNDWEAPEAILFDEQIGAQPIWNANNKLSDFENHGLNGIVFAWDKNVKSARLKKIKNELQNIANQAGKDFHCETLPLVTNDMFSGSESGNIAMAGDKPGTTWEMRNFYHASLTVVMEQLTQVQLNICILESAVLMQRE